MTASANKTITRWLAGAGVLVVITALTLYLLNKNGPEIPQVDLSAMEPRVSAQIRMHLKRTKRLAHPEGAQKLDQSARLASRPLLLRRR